MHFQVFSMLFSLLRLTPTNPPLVFHHSFSSFNLFHSRYHRFVPPEVLFRKEKKKKRELDSFDLQA